MVTSHRYDSGVAHASALDNSDASCARTNIHQRDAQLLFVGRQHGVDYETAADASRLDNSQADHLDRAPAGWYADGGCDLGTSQVESDNVSLLALHGFP